MMRSATRARSRSASVETPKCSESRTAVEQRQDRIRRVRLRFDVNHYERNEDRLDFRRRTRADVETIEEGVEVDACLGSAWASLTEYLPEIAGRRESCQDRRSLLDAPRDYGETLASRSSPHDRAVCTNASQRSSSVGSAA